MQPTFSFEIREKPWNEVLEWLSANAGAPVVGSFKVTGNFTFIDTQKKARYTLAEIVDILNESLLAQKHLLLRRPTSITVLSVADPKGFDPTLVSRVAVEDLDTDKPPAQQRLGRTELVRVIFQLKNLMRDDADAAVKAMLGPFGRSIYIARGNQLLVMDMVGNLRQIKRLLDEMDRPTRGGEVRIFPLKNADARAIAQVLHQLFARTAAPPRKGGRGPGTQGGPGDGQPVKPPPLPAGATPTPPAAGDSADETAIELRITVDQRTNGLIVAGSRHDLILVEAIITRLDSTDIRERRNEVYKLKNTNALDVATALSTFLRTEMNVLATGELTPFSQIEREVVVVPEQISNSLIISATPRFYEEVIRLIEKLDEEPPQVVIQVLVAEVRLDNSEEFGVEVGLQSPLLFARSVVPAAGYFGNGSVSFSAAGTNSLVPGGVTVNNSINPAAQPGFNFNATGPLGNNPVVRPGVVGFQGLGNLGVGRASSTSGVGGFVFSAASDTFNLLIRALKTQGRIDILSRPQITALDNQVAFIQVGQNVPYITNSTIGVTGQITNTVQQQPVGIILQVTPKISPDGHVVMRVEPQVSSLDQSTVNLGNNVFAPIFNITQASTTVSAMDGQTVVIGGLITRRDDKLERKIPCLGDIPYLGAAFRYRTHSKLKTELLIVLTPHVVRNRAGAERILAEETRKMDWCVKDVQRLHGPLGVEPILGDGLCDPLAPPELIPSDLGQPQNENIEKLSYPPSLFPVTGPKMLRQKYGPAPSPTLPLPEIRERSAPTGNEKTNSGTVSWKPADPQPVPTRRASP